MKNFLDLRENVRTERKSAVVGLAKTTIWYTQTLAIYFFSFFPAAKVLELCELLFLLWGGSSLMSTLIEFSPLIIFFGVGSVAR